MSNNFNRGRARVDDSSKTTKTLLIVKSQLQSLTAVESFLRNRDWKIFSTTSVKDALSHMIQHQPVFVMISVDHPNKKIRNLPKVLAQAFPCCVIAFAENSAAASFTRLTESKSEYLLYPPVTGPAVERTVNKYYKDRITKQSTSSSLNGGQSNIDAGGNINIKGGISAQNLLAQMLSEEGVNAGGIITNEGPKSGAAYNPQSQTSGTNNEGPSYVTASTEINKENSATTPGIKSSGMAYGGGPGSQGGPLTGPIDPSTLGKGHFVPPNPNEKKGGPSFNPVYPQKKADEEAAWKPAAPEEKQKPGRATDADGFIRTKNHQESIILKGTKEALDKSVSISENQDRPAELVKEASNVACIVIDSSRFSGYLVAAMGKNRKIDDEFVQRIRDRLFGFLAANGEEVSNEDSMGINIKEVPFEDWAVECAEFLRKSVHNGDEVAMAFFPYADVKAKVEQSANEEMVTVSLDEIKIDVPVEFNLYIYLPTNQKYILYTPRGGKLYENQKDKLGKQGIKQIHMMKNDVHDFNKYRAQNYLNGKIEEFESTTKVKKAAG